MLHIPDATRGWSYRAKLVAIQPALTPNVLLGLFGNSDTAKALRINTINLLPGRTGKYP